MKYSFSKGIRQDQKMLSTTELRTAIQ